MGELAKTILVVEDDGDVREVAIAAIEYAGYRTIAAASGDAAHRFLVTNPDLPIDVLFTDVVMPGRLDGVDLANAARVLRPDLHVLYATGFANLIRADRETDLQGPVLRKPYRPGELYRALAALLEKEEDDR